MLSEWVCFHIRMDTTAAQQIAQQVREAIAERDLTKSSVAETAGIPWATFSRKINGHSEFTVSELLRIAAAIGVRPGALLPPAFEAVAA